VVNFTPRPLYPPGKSPRYPLDGRLGGPQSRSGRFGEEKKILDSTGTRTPIPLSSSPKLVAISAPICPCSTHNIARMRTKIIFARRSLGKLLNVRDNEIRDVRFDIKFKHECLILPSVYIALRLSYVGHLGSYLGDLI
jgi:hypothetical protein